ncbi:MAG: AAA family ATPase [Spirosoma sp.]|nr:AAA family ATPase [Spirosoma sp.]
MIYLQRLVLRQNKVIQDLTLDFNGLKPMTVLIGENGSGKTTVLESLTAIFAALYQLVDGHKVTAPAFDFELTYLIKTEELIEETSMSRSDKTNFVEVIVSGERNVVASIKTIVGDNANRPLTKDLLPNLVIYYPGSSDTLLHTYQRFEQNSLDRLRSKPSNSVDAFSRIKEFPIFYYQNQHFDMLLATLLAFEYGDVPQFLTNNLNISLINNSSIGLYIKPKQFKKDVGINEFWGSEGEVLRFLNFIREHADYEILNKKGVANNRLSFFFTQQGWYQLREQYVDEKSLFLMLNMLDASNLLGGFNIALRRNGNLFPHFFLSEGERQRIIIKGLAELLFSDHTLFLLDEPNVFMHPSWQNNFMEELSEYTNRANFIITTHSPIILSSIKDGHLIRMYAGQGEPIVGHYYGRQYSDNLEDFMGTPSRIAAVSEELRILFDMIDNEQYSDATSKLKELQKKYGSDDSDLIRAQAMLNFYQ